MFEIKMNKANKQYLGGTCTREDKAVFNFEELKKIYEKLNPIKIEDQKLACGCFIKDEILYICNSCYEKTKDFKITSDSIYCNGIKAIKQSNI